MNDKLQNQVKKKFRKLNVKKTQLKKNLVINQVTNKKIRGSITVETKNIYKI